MTKALTRIFFFISLFPSILFACDSFPEPVKDLNVSSFYSDSRNSIVDINLKSKHDVAVQPLENFMKQFASLSDIFAKNPNQGAEAGKCALTGIMNWAQNQALLGEMKGNQSSYERKWMLAGLSLAYAKVKPLAPEEQNSLILNWLEQIADHTMEDSDQFKGPRNNHYYWEGLAVTAVGALSKKEKYLKWGRKVLEFALGQIETDGSLPLEMNRGQKALHYHSFSSAPLVLTASILHERPESLKKLGELTYSGIRNPNIFKNKTGIDQDPVNPSNFAWLEVYIRLFPNPEIASFLKSQRPLRYNKLGGNLTNPNPLETIR